MNIDCYEYSISKDFLNYEFFSERPKGKIKKFIRFELMAFHGHIYFNLSFGDLKEDGTTSDIVTSNNQDTERVLATVAHAVIAFTNYFPEAMIYAEGSTPSRTRRYQMGINKFWNEIKSLFNIYGLLENKGFEPFMRGKNYLAFVALRKKRNFISTKS
jgi:hypothetical protein